MNRQPIIILIVLLALAGAWAGAVQAAPAYTEFYVSHGTGAGPLNAGTSSGAAVVTTTNGSWNSGTGVYIAASGIPFSGLTAGTTAIMASIYPDGSAATGFIGLIISVDSSTQITVSITAKTGTVPITGGTGVSCTIDGAFGCIQTAANLVSVLSVKAPSATSNFSPRINIPTGTTFNEAVNFATNAGTAALPITVEGYTTNPGDIDSEVSTVRVPIRPVVVTITNGTPAANPCVVTVASGHNFGVGQVVKVAGAAGGTWASLNGDRTITAMDATHLTFGAVDASGYGTNTTGGTASPFDGTLKTYIFTSISYNYFQFLNLSLVTGTAGNGAVYCASSYSLLKNCDFAGAVSARAVSITGGAILDRCLVTAGDTSSSYPIVILDVGTALRSIFYGQTGNMPCVAMSQSSMIGCVVFGSKGMGIAADSAVLQSSQIRYCVIADNAGGGLDCQTETILVSNAIAGNIIAHNGTTNTGGSLTKATPGVLTIASQATRYANGTAVQFSGSTITAITDRLTYFLKQSAGSSPNWTYTICTTAAVASNIDCSAGTANSSNLTSNIGFGIASSVTGGPYRLGVFSHNNLFGNACGPIQTFAGNADGTVSLLDNGLYNDSANDPFTGSTAAARLANYYQLAGAAKNVMQYFANTNYVTYPDLGALQSASPASGGSINRSTVGQ
jgi:hypothetical protein